MYCGLNFFTRSIYFLTETSSFTLQREGVSLNPTKVKGILGLNEEEANAELAEEAFVTSDNQRLAAATPEVIVLSGKTFQGIPKDYFEKCG